MKIAVIIQARMGSTRFPGKIMGEISHKPMLWHVIDRVKKSTKTDLIIVATTKKIEDYPVLNLAENSGVKQFAGSEEDVLDRYFQAAKKFEADIIVRITADCPLIDPKIIDRMIEYYLKNQYYLDYVGIAKPNLCPDGLDTEIFSFEALKKAWMGANMYSEREHVTPYIWKNKDKFKIGHLFHPKKDLSHYRWTVDEEADLEFVREIYKYLYREGKFFSTKDVMDLLEKKPDIMEINNDIIRNEGYLKSLSNDKVVE